MDDDHHQTPPAVPPGQPWPAGGILRGWLHIATFWASGIASIVLNVLVVAAWRNLGAPPRKSLAIVIVLVVIAAVVYRASALRPASEKAHRHNARYVWSALAGICYGVGFLWPPILLILSGLLAMPGPKSDLAKWVAFAFLGWWAVALPMVLGKAFGQFVREIRPDIGVCTTCGYDLRATAPGRCPECGSVVPASPSPSNPPAR
jgi:hypothetical protein